MRRLLLWVGFGVAALCGFLFEQQLVRSIGSLIPDPNANRQILYWQSPMDPGYRSDGPGKSPMGMDLVPVYAGEETPQRSVVIAPEIQEREHTTALVEHGPLARTLDSVSTVTFSEPLIGDVTLKVDAWLEKLHVDYEGQTVRKGDLLFEVYAPDLVAAQETFLIALRALKEAEKTTKLQPDSFEKDNLRSARDNLRYLDVTDEQINRLERTGIVRKTLKFYSPFSGIVIKKQAYEGKSIPAGRLLYRIADLSKVWVNVFVYENQIHCVYEGQPATLTLSGLPGRTFRGKVLYIYPYLERKSRTVKVRLEFPNPDLFLMPDMFGRVRFGPHRMGVGLSVPENAVMQTGERSLVYIALPGNRFEPRVIKTGMEIDGNKLEVLSGLKAGERVILSPEFLMDSESRLRLVNRKYDSLPTMGKKGRPRGKTKMKMKTKAPVPPMKTREQGRGK
ncbi:MAG: efflux RND transporter periplasmic adaptor subunit [Planctomycetaceae bacterium]